MMHHIAAYLLALLVPLVCSIALPAYLDTSTKQFVRMQQVTQQMIAHDMIFVGEFHNHIAGHAMELELLTNFYSNASQQGMNNFAMSLEMFERDVQFLVNGYMASEIPESFFLANSRPWSNYPTDYRPLVQYVKSAAHKQVLASNIPRRFAALVADGNETVLWEMPALEQSYYAPQIYAPHDQYYKIFYNMVGNKIIDIIFFSSSRNKDGQMKKLNAIIARNASRMIPWP